MIENSRVFPWLDHLPQDARREMYEEVLALGAASADLGYDAEAFALRLEVILTSWKATAEVHADPELYKALTQDHDVEEDFVEAPRPEAHSEKIREAAQHAAEVSKGLNVRLSRVLCSSQIPQQSHETTLGRSHWCNLVKGHTGDHRSRTGKTWTDAEEAVAWGESVTIPGQREGGHDR